MEIERIQPNKLGHFDVSKLFQMLPFLMPSMTTLNCETEEIQKILYIMQDLGIFLDPDYLFNNN